MKLSFVAIEQLVAGSVYIFPKIISTFSRKIFQLFDEFIIFVLEMI